MFATDQRNAAPEAWAKAQWRLRIDILRVNEGLRTGEKPQISPLRFAPVEMTILWPSEILHFQERPAELQIPRLRSG
jgi:hypothetical protein